MTKIHLFFSTLAVTATLASTASSANAYWRGNVWYAETSGFQRWESPIRAPQALSSLTQANADKICRDRVNAIKMFSGGTFQDLERGNQVTLSQLAFPHIWAHRNKNVCVINDAPLVVKWSYPARVIYP